jgi:hypothetical protein
MDLALKIAGWILVDEYPSLAVRVLVPANGEVC